MTHSRRATTRSIGDTSLPTTTTAQMPARLSDGVSELWPRPLRQQQCGILYHSDQNIKSFSVASPMLHAPTDDIISSMSTA
jgi:hypothetical protein